jgi:hypothetical protein
MSSITYEHVAINLCRSKERERERERFLIIGTWKPLKINANLHANIKPIILLANLVCTQENIVVSSLPIVILISLQLHPLLSV